MNDNRQGLWDPAARIGQARPFPEERRFQLLHRRHLPAVEGPAAFHQIRGEQPTRALGLGPEIQRQTLDLLTKDVRVTGYDFVPIGVVREANDGVTLIFHTRGLALVTLLTLGIFVVRAIDVDGCLTLFKEEVWTC